MMKLTAVSFLFALTSPCIAIALDAPAKLSALPPPEDVPEEILRTEIILNGRSPIDGKLLTASEYVKLQNKITQKEPPITLNNQIRELIFLLRLRKLWKTITPF